MRCRLYPTLPHGKGHRGIPAQRIAGAPGTATNAQEEKNMWMLDDRRRRRSGNRGTALRFQLEHARNRGKIEALVLADRDGLVLAQAGKNGVCEELGAYAPLYSRSPLGMRLPPMLRGGEVAVRPMRLHGQDLYLASLGGGVARDALLSHSSNGIQRILTAN